ncbi:LOW QUALITY PROTEIN: E3 ubiquitin/ISG15 ligase TRIM25-like [Discoglossus pictus]
MASVDLREELICSICLNIYTDPIMLACGHNYCQGCIGSVLDTQEESGVFTCPECREEFQDRPAMQKNLKLGSIAQHLLSTPEHKETQILCTSCESPVRATKTCFQSGTLLCALHLKDHTRLLENVLTEPTTTLEDRTCPIHKKLLEYYCTDHAVCICASCGLFGEHKGHQVELLNEAAEKKKEKWRNDVKNLNSKGEENEKRVQSLQKQMRDMPGKAAGLMMQISGLFKYIREKLESLENQALNDIFKQEEHGLLKVSELIQQLEKEKEELSRKISNIEKLCNITDPQSVLLGVKSDNPGFCDAEDGDNVSNEKDNKEVLSVEDLDEVLILEKLHQTLANMLIDVKLKKEFYVKATSDILIDVKTSGDKLFVSDDLKIATDPSINQHYPKTPERFDPAMILSTICFSSGQHYWRLKTKTSESGVWRVGVAYTGIKRSKDHGAIGNNSKSWCLRWADKNLSAIHNLLVTKLSPESSCHHFGIYLDYEAGRLSFYQLCNPVRHLHTFITTFTEPLHAAFMIKKCTIKINSEEN